MTPEEIDMLITALSKPETAPTYSYIIWVFLSLLTLLVPLLIKLIRSINTNQRIMDLHIDELKHIIKEQEEQGEKIDMLDKHHIKTTLQVKENTTFISVLKEKC